MLREISRQIQVSTREFSSLPATRNYCESSRKRREMEEKVEDEANGRIGGFDAVNRSTKRSKLKQVPSSRRKFSRVIEDCWRSKCRSQGLVGRSSEVY